MPFERDPWVDWYVRDPVLPPPACECPSWIPVEDADGLLLCIRCGKRGRRAILESQLAHALRERDRTVTVRRPSKYPLARRGGAHLLAGFRGWRPLFGGGRRALGRESRDIDSWREEFDNLVLAGNS
jgi:hypothetical protein